MTTPQPLNCINCKHREVNSNDDYYCTVIGDFIAGEIEMFTTALVGCASHSSATHTPAAPAERLCDECNILELEEKLVHLEQDLRDARKAEREQVLMAFDSALNMAGNDRDYQLHNMKETLKSLRGGAP